MSEYPGIDKQLFEIQLSKDMFYNPTEKLKVTSKPRLTFWSKIKKFFGCKNLTWTYKVEKI